MDKPPVVPGKQTPQEAPARRRWFLRTPVLIAATACLLLVVVAAALVAKHRRDNAALTVPHAMVSVDGSDFYRYRKVRNDITVSAAPGNRSWNLRNVFWLPEANPSVNQQVCIDWLTPDGRAQPGLALRVRPSHHRKQADGIYLLQDLWGQNYWVIAALGAKNNYLDTSHRLALFNVWDEVHMPDKTMRRGPWRVCARVVGQELSMKIWFPGQPEPRWDAVTGVLHATIPAKWVWAGLPAAYVGHIKPNESFSFTNLRSQTLPNP